MNHTIQLKMFDVIVWAVSLLFAFGLLVGEAMAESRGISASNATWKAECGSCHIAYPPALLPGASWQRLIGNLQRHFGTDASTDAAAVQDLSAWLVANAGSYKRVREPPPEDRITRSAWFVRKHDEIAAATWKSPAVKSAANCNACHARADQGEFNEHEVRIPR